MATTTYTTPGQTTRPTGQRANRALYWGIAIAALIVLAIAFAMRSSREYTPAPTNTTGVPETTTTNETMRTNESVPATSTSTINNNGATVNDSGTTTDTLPNRSSTEMQPSGPGGEGSTQ